MVVDYPKIKSVVFWNADSLSEKQKGWRYLLDRLDSVLNQSLIGLEDRIRMDTRPLELSEFLSRIHQSVSFDRDSYCADRLLFDCFGRIAVLSEKPLKTIIESPNSELVKVECRIPANKAKALSSKAIDWLARRPGTTIQEKIGSENRIQTDVTIFTNNTKENQEAVYLYRGLYDIFADRLAESRCQNCDKKHGDVCGFWQTIDSLVREKTQVTNGALSGVKPVRQPTPNNKLLDDPNYRVIRKAVASLDAIDKEYQGKWLHVREHFYSLAFWAMASDFGDLPGVKVSEKWGRVVENENGWSFGDGPQTVDFMVSSPDAAEIATLHMELESGKIRCFFEFFSQSAATYLQNDINEIDVNLSEIFDLCETVFGKEEGERKNG